MEKNISGTNPSPDRDDMELKRHLNAAFELDTLTVSEDLIQRTLLKIKEMDDVVPERQESVTEKIRKRYPARRFVGAAAAVLLLVTAVWAYQNSMTFDKTDKGTAINEKMNIMQAVPNAESPTASDSSVQDNTELKIGAAQDSSNAGGSDAGSNDASSSDISKSSGIEQDPNAAFGSSLAADAGQVELTAAAIVFSQRYAINAEDIKSFTAEKADDGKEQEKSTDSVSKLYALMDKYTAIISDTQASGNADYRFVITDKDEKTITFEFYTDSIISVTDKRTPDGTITYTIDNGDGLLKEIGNFLKE